MTEDDTFRKLKQTPYDELVRLSKDNLTAHWAIKTVEGRNKTHDEFLAEHGWTYLEYLIEQNKRF